MVSELDLENKLWESKKYWQCQLFTNTHGINSVYDLYASKRKGCRKKKCYIVYNAIFGCPVSSLLHFISFRRGNLLINSDQSENVIGEIQ